MSPQSEPDVAAALIPGPELVAAAPPLTGAEAAYAARARAANTLRGYRSDWLEFHQWCAERGMSAMPGAAAAVSQYLTELADHGAKVGTISRRLSAIRYAHTLRRLPSPTDDPRVTLVWEGIRRTHGEPPDQSKPLMPPMLFDAVDSCPTTKTWRTPGRPPEPDLAGLRDRALLLVMFVAALRRSEASGLDANDLGDHPNGVVAKLTRSKTNQQGATTELVVLPRGSGQPHRSPAAALRTWLDASGITEGPVFRPISKGNRVLPRRLHPEPINRIVQAAVERAGHDPTGYTAHSLRAGFVTYSHLRGASDRAIAHQTRHRSLAALGAYVRVEEAWTDNAATELGF